MNFGEKKVSERKDSHYLCGQNIKNVRKYFEDDDKKKKHAINFPKLLCMSEAPYLEPFVHQNTAPQWDNTVAFGATFAQRATLALIYMSDLIFA